MEDEVTDTKKHLGETSNDEKERSARKIKDEQLALRVLQTILQRLHFS